MVIDRLGIDLQKKFEECGRRFPRKLVLQLGVRLVGFFHCQTVLLHLHVSTELKVNEIIFPL